MHIEIVTDTFAPDVNGVAMTLGRLTEGLRRRGHQVHVTHTGASAGMGESRAAALPLPGYKEVRVGLPKPFALKDRWLKSRPDVVYVATESPLGLSAVKSAAALDIPVAAGFHTNFQDYMSEYRMGILEPMAMAYLRRFHRRADCTLVPSDDLIGRLTANGFERVLRLGRGVDTGLFTPDRRCESLRAAWDAGRNAPVAIMVGRVAAEKNFDLAVRTFERIRSKIPDARCVVVGDGPLRERLASRHRWIRFVGLKTGEELARHYASADVLVFPSTTETFGNVLLEAMASGLATVSYDYAAAAIHVQHGENGLKVPKGDEQGFIDQAITALAMRPGHPLREAARHSAEHHGWDQVVADFENTLKEITARSAGPPPQPEPAPKPTEILPKPKRPRLHCRTVFLSDLHLGTPESKAEQVVDFLKHVRCRKLVLNGDIIDGWALRRGAAWTSAHSRVIRRILKMTERHETEVIYLRGNHDEILERFLPLAFGRVRLMKETVHQTAAGKRYLVVHGDGFDSISTRHKWLASLGAAGYEFLLKINRFYNHWRAWRGKEYYSLSKKVKASVKSAVCFVDRYEELLQQLARHRGCDGIICGHIHTPEDKQVGDIHYLNSGDWVESLTAIIETDDGQLHLLAYEDMDHWLQHEPQHPQIPAPAAKRDERPHHRILQES
jgi:UDP-2,3-diacylglucosamine pyrophosphatase LpxH/glycosyltransferase involved in cell wall biosynthesis